jgi:hypothetical protein
MWSEHRNRLMRILWTRLPHHWIFDRLLLLPGFVRGHGRLPRHPDSPHAWPSDYVFHRTTSDEWTDLERRAVDKIAAREIASGLVPELKFAPLRAVFDVPPGARVEDLRELLKPYAGRRLVAKPAHSCGGVLFLNDEPTTEEWRIFHARCTSDYYVLSRERNYRGMPKRILVEDELGPRGSLYDVKFRCSRGRVVFGNVGYMEGSHRRLGFYTCPEWKPLSFDLPKGARLANESRRVDVDSTQPQHLEEMLDFAARLSQSFAFVRVDFYDMSDGVYFGEFTFTPSGGRRPLLPNVAANLELARAIRGR